MTFFYQQGNVLNVIDSSNVNEVVRPIFNFLFFYKKRLYTYQKHKKAQKSTKKAPKSIEKPKAQRPNQAKAQNVNKSILVTLNL